MKIGHQISTITNIKFNLIPIFTKKQESIIYKIRIKVIPKVFQIKTLCN